MGHGGAHGASTGGEQDPSSTGAEGVWLAAVLLRGSRHYCWRRALKRQTSPRGAGRVPAGLPASAAPRAARLGTAALRGCRVPAPTQPGHGTPPCHARATAGLYLASASPWLKLGAGRSLPSPGTAAGGGDRRRPPSSRNSSRVKPEPSGADWPTSQPTWATTTCLARWAPRAQVGAGMPAGTPEHAQPRAWHSPGHGTALGTGHSLWHRPGAGSRHKAAHKEGAVGSLDRDRLGPPVPAVRFPGPAPAGLCPGSRGGGEGCVPREDRAQPAAPWL